MPRPVFRGRPLLAALLLWAGVVAIGLYAGTSPAIDRRAAAETFGTFPILALRLSDLGRLPAYVKVGAPLALIALFARAWRARIAFSLAALLAADLAADGLKALFREPRPTRWIGPHETTYAYPSSHASTAVAFYALWAYFILSETRLSPRPRAFLGGLCAMTAYGVCWSRVALGAHRLTDVAGGALTGLAVVVSGYALAGSPAPPREDDGGAAAAAEELSESSL